MKNYNNAAALFTPPRPQLEIAQVLEYIFLGQFDLLRDSRFTVQEKLWARAAEREASAVYFKQERSKEELTRLNVEAHRLATFIRDSNEAMRSSVATLEATDKLLAYQVCKWLTMHEALNHMHLAKLQNIENLPGFSGTRGAGHTTSKFQAALHSSIRSAVPCKDVTIDMSNLLLNDDEDDEEQIVDTLESIIDVMAAASD